MTGRSAHAGRDPENGRNAIAASADLAVRLHAIRTPVLAVNPAKIEGGGPNNVVPDNAVLLINLRPASHDEIVRAQATVDTQVAQVATAHDGARREDRRPRRLQPFPRADRRGRGAAVRARQGLWRATRAVDDPGL